ncbi:MAG: hypothetical protein JSV62_07970 [Promethearchaeota archaeon]|nr:MAG: hypothetical protein JSV62_07970 [Candidatus Lokiarchaeota archaeon]
MIFSTLTINSILIFHVKFTTNNFNSYSNNLENSAPLWATLSLTNPAEINESRFTLGSTISIQGRLYNSIPPTEGKDGYTVDIEINDVVDSNFNDITQGGGYFQIDYTIDLYLDVYSRHKISVSVRNPPPDVDIINTDYYIIDVNTTSNFEITYYDTSPKLTEEKFNIIGSLRYDNGLGIPDKQVDYVWLDGLTTVDADFFISGETGGLSDPQIPITSASDLTLKLNYSEPPFVSYSERFIYNIKVFSDVQWDLNIDYTTTEGATYILTGTLFSSTDPSLRISNREVEVYFNNTYVTSATTDTNGYFTSSFIVPLRNGTASIHVQLVNIIGKDISSVPQYILVESAPPTLPGGGGLPPFLLFSIIFFPILGGVVAGLAVYGYKYYKKQEKESRVINLPLESKINNLKILKDSGRLEESISYLFNAIYMDLINAKYNRTRNDNETIRDFAIVSVKELRLTPSSIYPFIQKVEEIIYAKPFKITDKDFYNTCELFSPIYFQLTGYNFVLNF